MFLCASMCRWLPAAAVGRPLFRASALAVTVLAVAAVVLVAFYWWVYRVEGRRLTANQRRLLWLIRIAVACLVLLMLARPALDRILRRERPPVVGIVVDESASMGFPDEREDELTRTNPRDQRTRYDGAKKAVALLWEHLSATHRVKVFTTSDAGRDVKGLPEGEPTGEPVPLPPGALDAALAQPEGAYSNLGDGLTYALRALKANEVSGLFFLSDARVTGGTPLDRVPQAMLNDIRSEPIYPLPTEPDLVSDRPPRREDGYLDLGDGEFLSLKDRSIYVTKARAGGTQFEYYRKYKRRLPAIHGLAFGADHPLRDLRIDEVSAPPETGLGDLLTFSLTLTNFVQNVFSVPLRVFENDKLVRETRVSWTQMGQKKGVTVHTIPETEGERVFKFVLPQVEDEINTENNEFLVTVKVVRQGLRVLLIGGQPTLEYHYLVPALLRDPIVKLSCFLQSADVDYIHQGNSGIDRLPRTTSEWNEFDVVVLADVDPKGLSSQQVSGLETLVRKGGGLLVIAGRTFGLDLLLQVHPTKITEMLPVRIDKNEHPDYNQVFTRAFRALRTAEGAGHPAMICSPDAAVNERIWSTFPTFYWHHPVIDKKRETVVLLEADALGGGSSGSRILMAASRYGEGAVFYSGLNTLWRWRYPCESYDYDRLWTRVTHYLGETRLLGAQKQVSLSTDKRVYGPGEDVIIILRVQDPALFEQLRDEPVVVTVTGSEGDRLAVELVRDPTGIPEYRGLYSAGSPGEAVVHARHVSAKGDSEAKPLFDVKHRFDIKLRSLEELDTSADLEGMRGLAQATGGTYLDYRSLTPLAIENLARSVPRTPQELTPREVVEVWDTALALVLFLVLVTAEWCLRKLWGVL